MSRKVLILGGTKEAAELAQKLVAEGANVTTSLAGRTREPKPIAGDVRSGGFGGVEKMAEWIAANRIDLVVDATHPFAMQISANAQAACAITDVQLDIKQRKPWQKHKDDIWQEVDTLCEAAKIIPKGARVLLALGSQYLHAFETRNDVAFVVRMVDAPESPPDLKSYELLLGRPSGDWQIEANLLRDKKITHIVCRNSGGSGAYAKIVAARSLAIPVILINMPR
ncbi:MAG: cobalt-precorrin-6A reductase [Rhizobiaceae bacterium]